MALTKETVIDKIEVLERGEIQVRTAIRIKEDGVQLSQSYLRTIFVPCEKIDGTWTDTDISGEDSEVQAQANAKWTPAVKTAFKAFEDARAT
jgi:hypothetical protein